jgi:hypothetical protein
MKFDERNQNFGRFHGNGSHLKKSTLIGTTLHGI